MAGGYVGAGGVFCSPAAIPAISVGFFVVIGAALAIVNTLITLMWAVEADTIDNGERRKEMRTERTAYALLSLTRKVGEAVGGTGAAYAIGLFGYAAAAEAQPETAVLGIRAAAGVVPAGMLLVAVSLILEYELTEARHAELVEGIHGRRAAEAGSAGPKPTV